MRKTNEVFRTEDNRCVNSSVTSSFYNVKACYNTCWSTKAKVRTVTAFHALIDIEQLRLCLYCKSKRQAILDLLSRVVI